VIDPTKSYTTRDGRPVRILCTDADGCFPVVGILDGGCAEHDVKRWAEDGRAFLHRSQDSLDLIPAPVRHQLKRYLNIYRRKNGDIEAGDLYEARADADLLANPTFSRIACLPITLDFVDGEGL
jgi:hypothetical protein